MLDGHALVEEGTGLNEVATLLKVHRMTLYCALSR